MKIIYLALMLSLFSFPLCSQPHETTCHPWGADSDLAYTMRKNTQEQKPKRHAARSACTGMIRFFQVYISPIDGPRSSFYPTSSQYALEAIQKYGVLQGIALGCDRLMRENGELWVYERTDRYGIERKIDRVR